MNATAAAQRLNFLLKEANLEPLDAEAAARFEVYLSLFIRWNARLNLSAVREEEQIMSRHLLESIAVARALPMGISTLLDFGSGAGLPGIPIALCRPDIAVTLAESQAKKAAFLQEVVRTLDIPVRVFGGRAEPIGELFDCVALRAVDKMPKAVAAAARLLAPAGWLALMTTTTQLAALKSAAGPDFAWKLQTQLPGASQRIVAFGARES